MTLSCLFSLKLEATLIYLVGDSPYSEIMLCSIIELLGLSVIIDGFDFLL